MRRIGHFVSPRTNKASWQVMLAEPFDSRTSFVEFHSNRVYDSLSCHVNLWSSVSALFCRPDVKSASSSCPLFRLLLSLAFLVYFIIDVRC